MKYYCDYCDTYLTHDSPSVRKTHCNGKKHKDNVKFYYQKWLEEHAQSMINETTAAFQAGLLLPNPSATNQPELQGAAFPPPTNLTFGAPPGQRMFHPGMVPSHIPPPLPGPIPPYMGPPNSFQPYMMPGIRPPVGPMMPMGPVPMRPPYLNGFPPQFSK